MSYNADAQVFETQIVVTNTTQPAGVTSGSIINKGSLSTYDTYVTYVTYERRRRTNGTVC